MTLHIDLLEIPCAEYCEHNGVRGVFIPETPNFRYVPLDEPAARKKTRSRYNDKKQGRAIIRAELLHTRGGKCDYFGKLNVWPEYEDAFLANPNTAGKKFNFVFGYKFKKGNEELPVARARRIEDLL